MAPQELRLAELLAALSVATDLGMGQPPGKAIRSCVVAAGLARALDLPEERVRDVYLATLLRHLGCSATEPGSLVPGGCAAAEGSATRSTRRPNGGMARACRKGCRVTRSRSRHGSLTSPTRR